MKDYKEINILLKNYFDALRALKNAEITSNKKDFTCQIGEWLVSEIYEGTRAFSGIQKDWDIDLNGKKIQVKTHAKAVGNKNRWSAIKYNEQANIDELIIVVFTEHYQLREFYKIPWQGALKLIRRNKDRDIIRWDHLKMYRMGLEDLPNQGLINMFVIT